MKKWRTYISIASLFFVLGFTSNFLLPNQTNTQVFSEDQERSDNLEAHQIQEELEQESDTTVNLENDAERIFVRRVVDGDTIELIDGRKLRYIGIDTPETVDPNRPDGCFGKQASIRNKELVDGKEILLEKDVSETDRYGRLLRYVYVDLGDEIVMVNKQLVEEGFANARSYPPDVKYQDDFLTAEGEARASEVGLWSSCLTEGKKHGDGDETVIDTGTSGECVIKGNISSNNKIYHLPGCKSYEKTVIDETRGERMFCSEEEALDAGWRKAGNC